MTKFSPASDRKLFLYYNHFCSKKDSELPTLLLGMFAYAGHPCPGAGACGGQRCHSPCLCKIVSDEPGTHRWGKSGRTLA